jgi:uncharacterized phage-like protein YoqJ
MATLPPEQIQEKKQLLVEKTKEMKAIYDELVEAGAIELSEEELEKSTGGLFLLPGVLEALQKFGHLF